LSGQALEFLEFAVVELEPCDALKLTHCSRLQSPVWVDQLLDGGNNGDEM
jgi:hypothetical protein